MTLTKAGLVEHIYKNHSNLTKSQSIEIIETFLSISKSSLIAGEGLLLSGIWKIQHQG